MITITTNISTTEPQLTSRIPGIVAETPYKKAVVKVVRDPEGDNELIYQTTLYAYDGKVEINAVGKLIEQHFRAKGYIYDTILVRFDDVAISFTALYCEYVLHSDFRYDNCFWSASGSSIVHADSTIWLSHWLIDDSFRYKVQVVGIGPDGRPAVLEHDFVKHGNQYWTIFTVQEILDFALNRSEVETEGAIAKVSYFAISYGSFQKLFYLSEDPEFLRFRFYNIFNVPEFLDVVGTLTRKSKADRDLAICDGRALQYNRKVSRTYELQTAALTEEQAKEIEQMAASHSVWLCAGDDMFEVLITDSTCEVDNNDDSLLSMKITFRFASERPTMRECDMGALMPVTTNIFTDEFTPEFS